VPRPPEPPGRPTSPAGRPARAYRYYDLLVAGFVTVLLCSNLIGPGKVGVLLGVSFGVGNLFFPISYVFGDVLTEVYGYARARRAVWAGFAALAFATVMSQAILAIPADPAEPFNRTLDPALATVFGSTWRIVAGSMIGFVGGDLVNSFVLAKMKVWTNGRYLWSRTIGSTFVGQGVDSLLFYPIAFLGVWETDTLLQVVAVNWLFKVAVEVVMTPFTYWAVGRLKDLEDEDFFDRDTRFTPFSLRV
jgi:uncharacterized integral membrane protein (TIGR00697 family)